MFGLDDWIAGLSEGASILVVLLVAALLGLRHATDPDHIAAMTTLVASGRERIGRSAARLGAWWGLGHAVTLVAFGIPILLAERYLPEGLQRGAETAVAAADLAAGFEPRDPRSAVSAPPVPLCGPAAPQPDGTGDGRGLSSGLRVGEVGWVKRVSADRRRR